MSPTVLKITYAYYPNQDTFESKRKTINNSTGTTGINHNNPGHMGIITKFSPIPQGQGSYKLLTILRKLILVTRPMMDNYVTTSFSRQYMHFNI